MKALKQYNLIETLSSLLLMFIIIIFSIYGIKLSFKLNNQLHNMKLAGNILFEVADKIKDMNYELLNNEIEITNNFNNDSFKPIYLNDISDGKVDIKINEPDGKNAGIKKVIIQVYWKEKGEIKSLFPVTIFKSKR